MKTLRNYIGGEWVTPAAADYRDLTNPATGEMLGRVPLSGAREVNEAVAAAQAAFLKWRGGPPAARARYLFQPQELLGPPFHDIAGPVPRSKRQTTARTGGAGAPGSQDA